MIGDGPSGASRPPVDTEPKTERSFVEGDVVCDWIA